MNRSATTREDAITFSCGKAKLAGILHLPDRPAGRGVLVVVGGPQYRVGSHRQFVELSRHLATQGIPVMRFDHRGIGDSDEPYAGFEDLNLDIAAAIDTFMARVPHLREVVLWGLCDAASAILFYAHADPRIAGIALLNPWVRTKESEARTYLRHYYLRRFLDREFWRKVASGRINLRSSASSLLNFATQRLGIRRSGRVPAPPRVPLPERMADGLRRFKGPVLLILSGQDLTAREFEDSVRGSTAWQWLLNEQRVARRDLKDADHTFSRRVWSDKVSNWTHEWINTW